MNILITNDDGINSHGICALAKEFKKIGNVVISAPDRQRSACSHSITMHDPITVVKQDFHGMNLEAYAVSGTPADCVKLAIEKLFNGKIDVCISGINEGANLGTDVLYSGTVSAAIEGALLNIPSIAVSLVLGKGVKDHDYDIAAYYTAKVYHKLINEGFVPGTVLNINVPSCRREELKGITATSLGTIKYTNTYIEKEDTEGNKAYWLAGEIIKTENGSTTDIYAVKNNYISITPMHFELTKYDYIDKIKGWGLEI